MIPDVSGRTKAIFVGISTAAYALSRGFAKNGVPYMGKPGDLPTGVVNESELEAGDLDIPVRP